MTAIALQQYIANKISDIDDDVILEKIKNRIDYKTEKIISLSPFQTRRIDESRLQFLKDDHIEQEEMIKKMSQWMSQK